MLILSQCDDRACRVWSLTPKASRHCRGQAPTSWKRLLYAALSHGSKIIDLCEPLRPTIAMHVLRSRSFYQRCLGQTRCTRPLARRRTLLASTRRHTARTRWRSTPCMSSKMLILYRSVAVRLANPKSITISAASSMTSSSSRPARARRPGRSRCTSPPRQTPGWRAASTVRCRCFLDFLRACC